MNITSAFAAIEAKSGKCRIRPMLVFGLAVFATACASESVKPTSVASTAPAAADGAVFCREVEVTGTRFRRRVCRTQEEWSALDEEQRAAGQAFTRDTQGNSTVVPPVENQTEFGVPAATFPVIP